MSIIEKITNFVPEEKKIDALMTFIYSAIQDYLKSDVELLGIAKYIDKNEVKLIYDEISNIELYLRNKVLKFEEMQNIVTAARKDKKFKLYYKKIENNLFYYDCIAKSALSKIKQLNNNEQQKWIPDYLIFCLLYDALDNDFSLKRYDFFNCYDFEKVFSIYRKVNKKIKEENDLHSFYHYTITRKMENVSITMIEKLKSVKFKVKSTSTKKN